MVTAAKLDRTCPMKNEPSRHQERLIQSAVEIAQKGVPITRPSRARQAAVPARIEDVGAERQDARLDRIERKPRGRWRLRTWRCVIVMLVIALFWSSRMDCRAETLDIDRATTNLFDACAAVETATRGTDAQSILEAGVCHGYVIGFLQGNSDPNLFPCISSQGFRTYDLIMIFNAFIKTNPVWRARGPKYAFIAAMKNAFAC